MRLRWKCTMPKAAPAPERADVVLAIRDADGSRVEYSGNVDSANAHALMQTMIKSVSIERKNKATSKGNKNEAN